MGFSGHDKQVCADAEHRVAPTRGVPAVRNRIFVRTSIRLAPGVPFCFCLALSAPGIGLLMVAGAKPKRLGWRIDGIETILVFRQLVQVLQKSQRQRTE